MQDIMVDWVKGWADVKENYNESADQHQCEQ